MTDKSSVSAQEALRNALTVQAATQVERRNLDSLPYTWKVGDLRLLVEPAFNATWNDNVKLAHDAAQDDYIFRPSLGLRLDYPITQRQLLRVNVTGGYNKYLSHNELSHWYLQSGSDLAFDFFVEDFRINVHERPAYTQDSAEEPAIAGTGRYGTFKNTVGVFGTWNLANATLTLGYDHRTVQTIAGEYGYTDHASELTYARAGLQVHPRITLGVEGSGSITAYDQQSLNDNSGYSAGVYGDWHPDPYFRVSPRFGYSVYQFEQTSHFLPAQDLRSWYADLSVTHHPTRWLSYRLSAGRELRLGLLSDTIEAWYVRPSLHWNVMRHVTLNTSFSYQRGSEPGRMLGGILESNYDWYSVDAGLGTSLTKRLRLSLDYRLTIRASDALTRDYTQNQVSLLMTYALR